MHHVLHHKTKDRLSKLLIISLIVFIMVIRSGFEPETHSLEGCCSIQLSYRTIMGY